MLGGGIPEGYSVLVAGPSGSGKSVRGTQFLMAGVRYDAPGHRASFARAPQECATTPPGGTARRPGPAGSQPTPHTGGDR